jgi:hypothetical protein
VNGAEVGTILDDGFVMGSSRPVEGGRPWLRFNPGGPNPGGTEGVEERDTWS